MSISMLNSHYNGVELHTGKFTTLQNCGCLSEVSVTHASYRNEHEYAPVPVQWRRCREYREQLTPIVCDRWRHMPVIGEGLQTQGYHFILEEKKCLALDANESWDEKSIIQVSHGIACPNTLSILCYNKCSWLTTFTECQVCTSMKVMKETYLQWCKTKNETDCLYQVKEYHSISRQ